MLKTTALALLCSAFADECEYFQKKQILIDYFSLKIFSNLKAQQACKLLKDSN